MIFKRKHEFKPDKTGTGALNKLHFTKKQQQAIFKWLLVAMALTVLSVIQDVVLSRVTLLGARINVVTAGLLLVCVLQAPNAGSIFILIGSLLYWCSGSAAGPYVIALLTVLGAVMCILRQSYLYNRFGSVALCAGIALVLYELSLFTVNCFLGCTTVSRISGAVISGLLSWAVIPLLYPIFKAIGKIGGESWKD